MLTTSERPETADVVARIADARRRLVETRIAFRQSSDELAIAKARTEQEAIGAAGGEKKLGENAEARARALVLALADDPDYQQALDAHRALEAAADRIEAELEELRDERRDREWEVRARLADALDVRGVQSDREGSPEDDSAFDDTADARAVDVAYEQASASRLLRDLVDDESPAREPDSFDRAVAESDQELAGFYAQRAEHRILAEDGEPEPEGDPSLPF